MLIRSVDITTINRWVDASFYCDDSLEGRWRQASFSPVRICRRQWSC